MNKDYILGIDIGHGQVKVSYLNEEKNSAEIYDFSFGQGNATIPSVAQEINGELILGDLAITMPGPIIKDISSDEEILATFINETLEVINDREPNARIKHITFAVPENSKPEKLIAAIEKLEIPKNLIAFKTVNDCILNFHFNKKNEAFKNLLVINYGAEALRINFWSRKEKGIYTKEGSYFDKELGMNVLEKNLTDALQGIYEEHTSKTLSMEDIYNIRAFTHENKNNILKTPKATKLYFNFSEPFEHRFSPIELVSPFTNEFEAFLKNFISWQNIDASDVEEVLLIGGGFNMPWPSDIVEVLFPDSNITLHKKPEFAISLGAALSTKSRNTVRLEKPILPFDIGIMVKSGEKEAFYPIIVSGEINGYQVYTAKTIVNLTKPFTLKIYKDDKISRPSILKAIEIPNLHKPEYAGALEIQMSISNNTLNVAVVDKSFENPEGIVAEDSVLL
ncbi:MAG: hypothetical protein FWE02_00390 [Defluviitaleaceae bacterium]|nr:hypothetical protein [Defluviitaleaceae bacterium]